MLYRGVMVDSERWERFEHRPGDIVISTPPESGTTWTQMLCALMLFDGPTFPAKLDAISPWLDMRIRSEDEVFGMSHGQTHRRFIKTHIPLDGLPLRDDAHYEERVAELVSPDLARWAHEGGIDGRAR